MKPSLRLVLFGWFWFVYVCFDTNEFILHRMDLVWCLIEYDLVWLIQRKTNKTKNLSKLWVHNLTGHNKRTGMYCNIIFHFSLEERKVENHHEENKMTVGLQSAVKKFGHVCWLSEWLIGYLVLGPGRGWAAGGIIWLGSGARIPSATPATRLHFQQPLIGYAAPSPQVSQLYRVTCSSHNTQIQGISDWMFRPAPGAAALIENCVGKIRNDDEVF